MIWGSALMQNTAFMFERSQCYECRGTGTLLWRSCHINSECHDINKECRDNEEYMCACVCVSTHTPALAELAFLLKYVWVTKTYQNILTK